MQGFRFAVLGGGLLLLSAAGPAQAPKSATQQPAATPAVQPAEAKTPPSAPANVHPLEKADLEAFFDGIFPLQMERSDIAGATVLVMQNGNVLFKKGYGYADLKAKKKPIQTLPSSGWHRSPSCLPGSR